jgi:hypothetical protein
MPSRRAPAPDSPFYEIGGWLLLLAILATIIKAIIGAPASTVTADCNPAYPDFCIAAPPPDLDCHDVAPHTRFRVLSPDPHHFDQDGNGIGCER